MVSHLRELAPALGASWGQAGGKRFSGSTGTIVAHDHEGVIVTTCEYETTGRIATRMGVNPRTVARWVRDGIIGKSGVRVRLAGVRVGRTIRVPIGAVEAFVAALDRTPEEDARAIRVPKSKTEADRIRRATLARLEFERLARAK